ncbi:HpcH/HpaI aldolase/citrate lyase family protein [Aspergillus parasiticus SU-1]|uniref:HpcH/HpaI aldolase/citrate lyase family protein n=1 Tax=Aspergillus parasiticus (strain ATCC 56775 / NRRL 5862 / SRRC 143 / SU-1) TaxID=1403190 RepID=A0A0F0I3E0_ASPPU|nr:HpcH/HpaI aldolase/citrate lyase family protein [Aspergillus parasiticus SU-1]
MADRKRYNALSLAQPTNFRAMLSSEGLLWGTACRIPHEEAARIVATLPHHFCFIDAEHTPLSATLLASIVRIINQFSNGSMVPVVRIPENSTDLITYALNAGAGGIIMPHVQNAAQAERLVQLTKFPPVGIRSYPPSALFGDQLRTEPGKTVFDVWDNHTAVFCQIEDVEGVKNVEEIAKVPGVDALMVGATDLRFSLGLPRGSPDGDEPVFLSALDKIQRAADANGLAVLGFAATPDVLERRIRQGWKAFVGIGDSASIFKAGSQQVEEYEKLSRRIRNETKL